MGFHIVLKGQVVPVSYPHLNQFGTRLTNHTPETHSPPPVRINYCNTWIMFHQIRHYIFELAWGWRMFWNSYRAERPRVNHKVVLKLNYSILLYILIKLWLFICLECWEFWRMRTIVSFWKYQLKVMIELQRYNQTEKIFNLWRSFYF